MHRHKVSSELTSNLHQTCQLRSITVQGTGQGNIQQYQRQNILLPVHFNALLATVFTSGPGSSSLSSFFYLPLGEN